MQKSCSPATAEASLLKVSVQPGSASWTGGQLWGFKHPRCNFAMHHAEHLDSQHPQTPALTPALAEGKGSSVLRAGEEAGACFGHFFPKKPLRSYTHTYKHTLPAAAPRLPKPQVPRASPEEDRKSVV